jgi:hypothetical protein
VMGPDHGGTELLRVPPPGVHDDLVVALGQIPERVEDIAPPLGAMDGPEAIECVPPIYPVAGRALLVCVDQDDVASMPDQPHSQVGGQGALPSAPFLSPEQHDHVSTYTYFDLE